MKIIEIIGLLLLVASFGQSIPSNKESIEDGLDGDEYGDGDLTSVESYLKNSDIASDTETEDNHDETVDNADKTEESDVEKENEMATKIESNIGT